MSAYEIQKTFGYDSLRLVERPDPVPAPGHLLLRMKAVSLNYRDLLTVQGLYNPKQPLPLVPLSDGVGEVARRGRRRHAREGRGPRGSRASSRSGSRDVPPRPSCSPRWAALSTGRSATT